MVTNFWLSSSRLSCWHAFLRSSCVYFCPPLTSCVAHSMNSTFQITPSRSLVHSAGLTHTGLSNVAHSFTCMTSKISLLCFVFYIVFFSFTGKVQKLIDQYVQTLFLYLQWERGCPCLPQLKQVDFHWLPEKGGILGGCLFFPLWGGFWRPPGVMCTLSTSLGG